MVDLAGELSMGPQGPEKPSSAFALPPIESSMQPVHTGAPADESALQAQYQRVIQDAMAQQQAQQQTPDIAPSSRPDSRPAVSSPKIELSGLFKKVSSMVTAPFRNILHLLKSIGGWIAK